MPRLSYPLSFTLKICESFIWEHPDVLGGRLPWPTVRNLRPAESWFMPLPTPIDFNWTRLALVWKINACLSHKNVPKLPDLTPDLGWLFGPKKKCEGNGKYDTIFSYRLEVKSDCLKWTLVRERELHLIYILLPLPRLTMIFREMRYFPWRIPL